jgi:hypothetical protein
VRRRNQMRSPNDSRGQASAARKACAPVWRNACGFRAGMPASAPSSARAALTARGTARCRGPLRRLAFPHHVHDPDPHTSSPRCRHRDICPGQRGVQSSVDNCYRDQAVDQRRPAGGPADRHSRRPTASDSPKLSEHHSARAACTAAMSSASSAGVTAIVERNCCECSEPSWSQDPGSGFAGHDYAGAGVPGSLPSWMQASSRPSAIQASRFSQCR